MTVLFFVILFIIMIKLDLYELPKKSKTLLIIALVLYEFFALFSDGIIQSMFFYPQSLLMRLLINPSFLVMRLLPIVLFIILFYFIKVRDKTKTDNLFNAALLLVNSLFVFSVSFAIFLFLARFISNQSLSVYGDEITLFHILPSFVTLIYCGLSIYIQKKKGYDVFEKVSSRLFFTFLIIFFAYTIFPLLIGLIDTSNFAYMFAVLIYLLLAIFLPFTISYIALGKKTARYKFFVSILVSFVFLSIRSIISGCGLIMQTTLQSTSISLEVLNSMSEIVSIVSMIVASTWAIVFLYITRKTTSQKISN